MNRTLPIVSVIAAVVAASTVTAVFLSRFPNRPAVSQEQRETRERFFGSNKEMYPIQKGQEMRPRW
ncbi:entry exclusion protein TrbK [Ensifer adhaerens]|nr:entry exclusion protein TrbK [Ensifer adhaerens]